MADWYYIGHYGQLGPLTREQIDELIQGGVIVRETYVWCTGMASWLQADQVSDLRGSFQLGPAMAPPPPPSVSSPPSAHAAPTVASGVHLQYGASGFPTGGHSTYPVPAYQYAPAIMSDRSRVAGGILNIVLPGVGRMYLGFAAIGVLQLIVTICTGGIGWIWPLIDGALILSGNYKYDGYGRQLRD